MEVLSKYIFNLGLFDGVGESIEDLLSDIASNGYYPQVNYYADRDITIIYFYDAGGDIVFKKEYCGCCLVDGTFPVRLAEAWEVFSFDIWSDSI